MQLLIHRDIEIRSVHKPKLRPGEPDKGEYMIKFQVQLKDMSLRNRFVKRVFKVMKDPSKQGFSQTFKLRGTSVPSFSSRHVTRLPWQLWNICCRMVSHQTLIQKYGWSKSYGFMSPRQQRTYCDTW